MSASDQICSGCVKVGDGVPSSATDAAAAAAPAGTETVVGGHPCFVVGSGSRAIVFCTDIFGWRFPNARAIAAQYAAGGDFTVYMPNYLNDAANPADMENFRAHFGAWLERNPLSRANAVSSAVASEVATKHVSVLAVGFCLGGRPVVDLVAAGLVRAAVVFHPTFLQEEDIPTIRVPVQFNCAATDNLFTPELRAAFEAGLQSLSPASAFIDYPEGTVHGFASRPEGALEQEAFKQAHINALAFFNAHA